LLKTFTQFSNILNEYTTSDMFSTRTDPDSSFTKKGGILSHIGRAIRGTIKGGIEDFATGAAGAMLGKPGEDLAKRTIRSRKITKGTQEITKDLPKLKLAVYDGEKEVAEITKQLAATRDPEERKVLKAQHTASSKSLDALRAKVDHTKLVVNTRDRMQKDLESSSSGDLYGDDPIGPITGTGNTPYADRDSIRRRSSRGISRSSLARIRSTNPGLYDQIVNAVKKSR
jgi:hypothetical protein